MIRLSEVIRQFANMFDKPELLFLILILVPLVFFLIRKDFIKAKEDPESARRKHKTRKIMYLTRSLIVILLVIAIASPHVLTEKTIKGDAYIQLLVDNSKSMALFTDPSQKLKQELEKKVNVEVKQICLDENSNIGDAVLNSMQPGGSILLLSDGNANTGASLGDVALYASGLNISINAVKLDYIKSDAGVMVLGPAKTMENAENSFAVQINKAGDIKKVHLRVFIDDEVVFDKETSNNVVEINKEFSQGIHKIIAEVTADNDFFNQNNVFYKTVRVVTKPNILFLSTSTSPLKTLLDRLYNVDQKESLPKSLSKYHAVVVNDMPASVMDSYTNELNDFIADGNGMVVVGGENSFNRGGYSNSLFESILPVFIGTPGKKEGDVNVALVIDISASTGSAFGAHKAVDVEKALAVNAFHDLSLNTRLAVIVFNDAAKLISPPSYVFEKTTLEEDISKLMDFGSTAINAGILKAIDVIGSFPGQNNIILISDGWTGRHEQETYEAAKLAYKKGLKIYSIGVGANTNQVLMMKIAGLTNGIYFKATEESRLKLLFGSPEEKEKASKEMMFTILDSNHFITRDLQVNALLSGFNIIAPKTTARLLATSSSGEPVLVISRLGLGRVAALGVDDGSKWAGELLNKQNSKIISRVLNWVIGDPDRKSSSFIEAKDTRIDESTEVLVKSETRPVAEKVSFYKIDEDTYSASVRPTAYGFQEAAGAVFAVNYPSEYEKTGFSKDLNLVAAATDGRIFDKNDIEDIVKNAKTKANRTIMTKVAVIWPFVALALVLFLLEIFIRRILRRE